MRGNCGFVRFDASDVDTVSGNYAVDGLTLVCRAYGIGG